MVILKLKMLSILKFKHFKIKNFKLVIIKGSVNKVRKQQIKRKYSQCMQQ